MKSIFAILTMAGILGATQLHLTPADKCGAFTTIDGAWSCLPPSDVTLSYNDKGVTLHGIYRKTEGETFIGKGKSDDDMGIFGGDVLEFQLNPPNPENAYYHIAFSPSGYAYTAKKRDMSWNPKGLERQTRISGNEWEFALFLPYSDLDTEKPADGAQWRINIARTNVDAQGTAETASYSGATDFHDTTHYSLATFGGAPAEKQPLLRAIRCTAESVKCTFERLANPNGTIVEYSIGDSIMNFPLTPEGKYWVFSAPLHDGYLPLKGSSKLSIKLKDKNTGKILFEQTAHQPEKGLKNDLLPDKFYYLANEGDIVIQHGIEEKSTITLRGDDGIVTQVNNAPGTVRIPLAGIKPGRYVVELKGQSTRTSRVIFILPQKPELRPIPPNASLKIAEHNYLELDGIPTFFLGLSDSEKFFLQFEPATNLIYVKNGAQPNGVLSRGMPPSAKLHRKPITSYQFPDLESSAKSIRDFAANINPKIPAIYRIRYEAQIPNHIIHDDGTVSLEDTKERFQRMYAEAKKANPAIIYSIQIDRMDRIPDFAPSCDVFEMAASSSSYAVNQMHYLPRDIDNITQQVPDKPFIFWLGCTVPNNSCRTAEELRCATYYCILRGVDGCIIHLGHGYLPEGRSRVWSVISGLLSEIQGFYADFVTGTNITEQFHNESNAEISFKAVRAKNGKIIVLAVNTSPVEVTFRGTLDGKKYEKRLTPFEPFVFK